MNQEEKLKSLIYGFIGGMVGLSIGMIAIFISKVPLQFGVPFTILAVVIGFVGSYSFWKLPLWARLITGG
jgi:hypothetical protein